MRRFTKIFSFYCLHWLKDQSVALRNIHRLLETGGEALLVFLARNPVFEVYRRVAKMPRWQQYMSDVERFVPCHQDSTDPAAAFAGQLSAAGLEVASCCEARDMTFQFGNANQLAAALRAVNPFVGRIPTEEERSAYMADLFAEIAAVGTQGMQSGRAVARYTLMVAHVRRPVVAPQSQHHPGQDQAIILNMN